MASADGDVDDLDDNLVTGTTTRSRYVAAEERHQTESKEVKLTMDSITDDVITTSGEGIKPRELSSPTSVPV
jgi:hypothetical protein